MADTQTITTTSQPFADQLAFLQPGFQASLDQILNRPQQYFPNSTVVPFSNQTEAALQGTQQRAMQGSPLNTLAGNQLASTMGGAYNQPGFSTQPNFAGASGAPAQLPQNPPNPSPGYQPTGPAATPGAYGGLNGMNPYLQNVANAAQASIQPGVDSSFSAAGRGGSGAHYSEMSKQMANAVAPFAFQNYENERGRQLQAAGMAPQQAAQDYADLAMLNQVGSQREGLARQQVGDDQARFNFGQQEPINRIGQYMGMISGNYGQQQTETRPLNSNSLLTGLGGAGIGASIGKGIGGFGDLSGGTVTGLGALAGGLLGLFA